MRFLLGALLLGHAVAHLPGFLVDLRVRSLPELPFKTTVLNGAVDLGEQGIRMMGVAWLLAAAALGLVALATAVRLPWWQPAAYVALGLSILLCILGWPDARLGLLANAAIVLMIVLGTRAHWL